MAKPVAGRSEKSIMTPKARRVESAWWLIMLVCVLEGVDNLHLIRLSYASKVCPFYVHVRQRSQTIVKDIVTDKTLL